LGNCPVGELSVGKCPNGESELDRVKIASSKTYPICNRITKDDAVDNILHWLDNDVSEYSESNSEEEIASDDEGIELIMAQQEQQPATTDIVDDDILMEEVVLWKLWQ